MVDLLGRIYRAELIKPASRNYLLDLMSRCETGKNRMKALLPNGTPVEHKTGTLNGLTDDVGFITLPDGRRIAIAIFTRGGSDRPRTIAEAARTIYDGFAKVLTWPFGIHADRTLVLLHIVARGKIGRSPEADLVERYLKRDRLADQGHRAARSRRQDPALRPPTASPSFSTSAARRCHRPSWPGRSKAGAIRASARRAS